VTLSTIEHDSETNSDLKQKLSWISKPSETKILFLSLRQVDLIEGFVQKKMLGWLISRVTFLQI